MPRSGREVATEKEGCTPNEGAAEALGLMKKALGIVDSQDVPHDIGAHLDLAIHRLTEWVEGRKA